MKKNLALDPKVKIIPQQERNTEKKKIIDIKKPKIKRKESLVSQRDSEKMKLKLPKKTK